MIYVFIAISKILMYLIYIIQEVKNYDGNSDEIFKKKLEEKDIPFGHKKVKIKGNKI